MGDGERLVDGERLFDRERLSRSVDTGSRLPRAFGGLPRGDLYFRVLDVLSRDVVALFCVDRFARRAELDFACTLFDRFAGDSLAGDVLFLRWTLDRTGIRSCITPPPNFFLDSFRGVVGRCGG